MIAPHTVYRGEYVLRNVGPAPTDPTKDAEEQRELWLPAIPLPFLGLRKRCDCGRKFWTAEGYRAHYALTHILEAGPKDD